jgi:hypothetical protein
MLDDNLRGILEKIIDGTIISLQKSSSYIPDMKKAGLDIRDELYYTMGYAHGSIRASFYGAFIMIRGVPSDSFEEKEVSEIIYRQTREFMDPIFKDGAKG